MFLADIALAITLAAPNMALATTNWYASIIKNREQALHIDPLIEISIATHESRWNSKLISKDGYDWGLMQIRAKYFTSNPFSLLNGGNNLYLGAGILKANYNFCAKFLGREPLPQEYLSCFQGSCTSKRRMCKPTRITKPIVLYAQCLETSLIDRVSKDCRRWSTYTIK